MHFRLARFARRTISASAMSFDESAAFSGRHRITLCRPLPLRTLRRMRHSLPKSVRICCLLGFIKPICANTFGILHLYLLVRRTDFYVLHIAKRKNGSYLSSPPKQNRRNAAPILLWRRGQDSNLRALASKLISSQPRYDHFDTSPYAPLSMRSLIKITYLVRKIKRFYLTCQISFAYCSMARSEENLPALAILSMLLV